MKALSILTTLYLFVLPFSLGAMEILAPLLMATALAIGINHALITAQRPTSFKWSLPLGFWPLIGLFAVAAISTVWNQLPQAAIVHGLGKLRWIAIYFFLHNILTNLDYFRKVPLWLLRFSPFISLIALFALTQFWTGFEPIRGNDFVFPIAYRIDMHELRWRSIGFFNNPLTYGYSLGGLSCLLVALYFQKYQKGRSLTFGIYSLVSLAIIFASIVTSYSRGVWVALFVGLIATLIKIQKKLLIASGILIVFAIAAYLPFNDELRERIFSMVDPDYTSNLERLKIWRANFVMFLDSPFLGVGYEYNDVLIGQYYEKLGITDAPESHAHNTYMQFLAGTGALGLLCFLAFLYQLMTSTWMLMKKNSKNLMFHGIFGLHVTVLVGGLTECNFKDAEINHLFIFFAAVVSAAYIDSLERSNSLKEEPSSF